MGGTVILIIILILSKIGMTRPAGRGGGEGGVHPPFLGPENIFSSFILQEIDCT